MHFKLAGLALGIAIALVGGAGVSSASATPVNPNISHTTVVDGTTVTVSGPAITTKAELDSFLATSTPKALVFNTDEAKITAVTDQTSSAMKPMAFSGTICSSSTACFSGDFPYSNWAVSGTGTVTGSYPSRNGFSSGTYAAQGYYVLPYDPTYVVALPRIPPYSSISLTGTPGTGVQVNVG